MKKREKAPKKVKKAKEPRRPERTETGGLDYSVYYMKPMEFLAYVLLAAAGLFALGYIFYRSVILAAVVALLALKYPSIRTKQIIAARRQKLNLQFKDMLYSLTSSLGAGNSVERAMSAALEDMERQYGNPNTLIIQELELIVSKLALGQNIEDLFLDLAQRSGIDDIRTFAHIFEISKRTGGNLMQIMRQTSDIIMEKIETKGEEKITTPFVEDYEFLHFVPPMSAPDFVREAGLGWTEGKLAADAWVMVDKDTLVHKTYPNIISLGDVAGIPTSKTSAAIRKQVPIAAKNLIALMEGKEPTEKYNGYAACPIVTDYGHVLLCEFDYEKKPDISCPFTLIDTSKEQWLAWLLKVYILKPLYFYGMLNGIA